jgi:hypothetical protein
MPIKQKLKKVLKNVPNQNNRPITNNSLIILIRQPCMKILPKEVFNISDFRTKTQRPLIQIKSIQKMEQKGLFDTGAGLTCMSLKAFINFTTDPQKFTELAKARREQVGAL